MRPFTPEMGTGTYPTFRGGIDPAGRGVSIRYSPKSHKKPQKRPKNAPKQPKIAQNCQPLGLHRTFKLQNGDDESAIYIFRFQAANTGETVVTININRFTA